MWLISRHSFDLSLLLNPGPYQVGRLNRAKSAPNPHNGIALVDIGSIKEIATIGFLVPGRIETLENICNFETSLPFYVAAKVLTGKY